MRYMKIPDLASNFYWRKNALILFQAIGLTIIIDVLLSNGAIEALQIPYNRSRTFFVVENFIFILACISIVVVFRSLSRENQFLKLATQILNTYEKIKPEDVKAINEKIRRLPKLFDSSISRKRTVQNLKFFFETESPTAVHEYNSKFSEMVKEEVESEFEYPRYCVWVIPIIGFVGTIYGITLSVQYFSSMLNSVKAGEEAKTLIENLGQICWGLSIAFETTLPALITSGLLAFFLSILDRFADRFIWALDTFQIDYIISRLIQPIKASRNEFVKSLLEIEKLVGGLGISQEQKKNLLKLVTTIKSVPQELSVGLDIKDTLKASEESWTGLKIVIENAVSQLKQGIKESDFRTYLNEINSIFKNQSENNKNIQIAISALVENARNANNSITEIKTIGQRQAGDLQAIISNLKEQLNKVKIISEVTQLASEKGLPLRLEITPSIGGNTIPVDFSREERI